MEKQEIIDSFLEHGALLKGHFKLSSGLHSDTYLQCARVLMHPVLAARLGQALAAKLVPLIKKADLVLSPALGGLIIGHEVARSMGHPHVFAERSQGEMTLRRGFHLPEGANVVLIEDVVTTGKSSREVVDLVSKNGGKVVVAGSIISRSGMENPFAALQIPYACLAEVDAQAWPEDQLPAEIAALPLTAPGSRFIKS